MRRRRAPGLVRGAGLAAALVGIAGVAATSALASDPTPPPAFSPKVTSEMSIGLLNGKAQEFVYNPNGSVLSRLDWRMDNVAMVNTATTIELMQRLKVGLKSSLNLTDGSRMDDYDFNLLGCPPAPGGGTLCHSNHPDTVLREALLLDVWAAYDVFRHSGFTVSAIAGYRHDYYRWAAIGGTANYGPLPPGLGITYEQTWSAPYVGLGFEAKHNAWTLRGRAVGSWWGRGDDQDDHHLRSLVFTEDFSGAEYLGADLGVLYRISPTVSVTADYSYQKWGTVKGPTTIRDRVGGGTFVIPGDAAGANLESHLFSLGLAVALGGNVPVLGPSYHGGGPWSGFYAGLSTGWDWQQTDWTTTGVLIPAVPPVADSAKASLDESGQRAELFAGWQTQRGNWVWGVELDIGHATTNDWQHGIPGTFSAAILNAMTDAVTVTHGLDGSARLRIGMLASPALLVYATGGVAFGEVEAAMSCPTLFPSWCIAGGNYEEVRKLLTGWTLGAGFDWQLGAGWFSRAEYRYTDLGSFNHTFFANVPIDAVTVRIDNDSHRITLGLGYRF